MYKLLFIALMLFAPWTMRGQFLETCLFGTGVDTTRWIALSNPTYVWSTYVDDNASSTMSMGFTFPLGGVNYTTFSVSSNGIFNLGGGAVTTTQGGMFNTSYYNTSLPKICGIAKDLGTGSDGYVRYELIDPDPDVDSDRVFVCEYAMGYTYGQDYDGDVKWQVQLHENSGKIVIVYGPAPSTTPSGFHIGIGLASDDIMVINPTTHAAIYSNGPYNTTYSTWPGEGRYYEIIPHEITCPKPIAAYVDSLDINSCIVHWTDTTGVTEWLTKISDGTTTTTAVVYDTTTSYSTLLPNTEYTFSVAGICGVDDTSLWRNITFRTPCSDISTLPWTESFESSGNMSSNDINFGVNCMDRLTDATSYYYPYAYGSTSYAHTGSHGLYWYSTNSSGYGSYTSIVLPPVDTTVYPLNDIQLTFWAKPSGTSYSVNFRVGVLSDPTDMETFEEVASINLPSSINWRDYIVRFDDYTGNGKYICIKALASSYWYAYVDDLSLEIAPDCPRVENISASAITNTSATLSWSETGEATEWNVTYLAAGLPQDSAVSLTATDSSIALTGLQPSTTYNVTIIPQCTGSAGSNQFTFTTQCNMMDSLPYFYGFEDVSTGSSSSATFGATCWNRVSDAQAYWYPYIGSSSYAHTGNRGLYWYNYSYSSSGYGSYQYICLPLFDTVTYPANTMQLRFWARSSSTSYNPVLYVGILTNLDDPNSFTPIDTIRVGNSTLWREFDVPLSSYVGPNGYVTISAQPSQSSSTWYCYLDDFTLESVPPCPRPSELVITSIDNESATIDWNDPDTNTTQWRLVYGVQGFDPESDTVTEQLITEHPVTITGLNPATMYEFHVAAECLDGDYSMDRVTTVFTPCAPIDSLPYFYGFEGTTASSSGTIDACWKKGMVGTTTNYPYPSSVAFSGTRSLYFYGYHSSNIKSYAAMPLFSDSIDNLQVSFKLRAYNTQYNYYGNDIDVGLMTNPYDINTFTRIAHCEATSTTVWDSFTVILYGHQTEGRYIAFLSQGRNSTTYYNYVYLDDVVVDLAPDCGPVTDVVASASVTSAIVSWTPSVRGETVGATVEYHEAADSTDTWNSIVVSENLALLTNLTPATQYEIRITNECSGGTSPVATYYYFTTLDYGCTNPDTTLSVEDTIGDSSSTNTYIPSYSLYDNGLSQQIYLASELTGLGLITGVRLHTQAAAQTRNWTIYLAHTLENTVSEWIVPTVMTEVWSGTVNYAANGWIDFEFDTPFSYDGSSNLLFYVDDHTGSYVSGNTAYTHSLPSGRVSRYIYRDGAAYDPYNPSTAGAGTGINYRCDMTFYGYGCAEHAECAAPPVLVTSVGQTSATLNWAPEGDVSSWTISYQAANETNWTYAGTVSDYTYTINGLVGGTDYVARVGMACGSDTLYTRVRFSTVCAPITVFPFFEDFNTYGTGTSSHAPDCWSYGSDYSDTYPYITSTTGPTGATGGSMYLYNSTYSDPNSLTWFSLPAVDTSVVPVNELQAVFYSQVTTSSYTHRLYVGVAHDPTDMSTFVVVDSVTPVYGNGWRLYEVPLSAYTDSGTYITFASHPGAGSQYCYPYVDDLTIERIPSCQRPDSIVTFNPTANSIDVAWRSRTDATDFIVEYGRIGFTPGTGTRIHATTNPFTISGLPSGYQGEVYVYNICSENDTSPASRFSSQFLIQQVPATVPYSYNFEDTTEWNTWQINSNNHVNWFRGTAMPAFDGNYSMYISPDYGTSFGTDMTTIVNAATWRDIDFGPTPTTYEITFRYKAGASTDGSYDGLMVFLVDTNQPIVASNSGITSPWGNVNDLYRIFSGRLDTAWTAARASFDTVSGVKRVAFFWFNQATNSTHPWIFGPAAVDNIEIQAAACPRPVNLAVDSASITNNSATITWDSPLGASFRIAHRQAGTPASTNIYDTTTSTTFTLTGLDASIRYNVWVQRLCDDTTSSLFSDGVEFRTDMCENAEYAYSYDPSWSTTTSYYAPIGYSTYNYSYVQTIVDSALLAGLSSGVISAFAYNPVNGTTGNYFTNMDVYLANVPENNLSSGFIIPNSTNHVFQQVVSNGDFNYTEGGWQIIGFDTTFTWDGHSNLLVAVNRRHGSWSSGATFQAHSTTAVKTRYVYQDSPGAYDPTTVNGGTTLNLVGDIMFISCAGPSCAEPEVTSVTHDYHSATLNWTGDGTNYEVNIKPYSADTWPADIAVTGYTHTFTGLLPATEYAYRIRQDCTADSLDYSDWVEGYFVTDTLFCQTPDSLHVLDLTNATATLDWVVNSDESAWDIHVWFTGGLDSIYRVTSHPATVGGFRAGLTYNATVRPLCGVDLFEGDWGDTITFTTAVCPNVASASASNVTANSADISWTADPMAQSWIVEYGFNGFDQGTGTTVTATTNSYQATGLECDASYDFYVRAVCGDDWTSENWTLVTFRTADCSAACNAPTGIETSVTANSVAVSWTPAEGNTAFEVEYGARGFSHGTGTTVSTTTPSTTINGLEFNTQYDLYVRALCGADNYSPWSTVSTFTTETQGIDAVGTAACTIFPNPASGSTTVSVSGVSGKVKIEVVDMNGRTVATETLECSADCQKAMDVDGLAQGAYFVRITADQVNMVKKLIIR